MSNGAIQARPGKLAAPARLPGSGVRPDELSRSPLFDNVGTEVVERLAAASSTRRYPAGASIIGAGERVDMLTIIGRGIVEMGCRNEQHDFGVLFLRERDLIMPAAALFDEPPLMAVRALTRVELIEMDPPGVRAALKQSPMLSLNLMKVMSGQWRAAVRNILDRSCRSAAQRLAAFLLRFADLQGGSPSVLPISKRALAMRLGITAESLSRALPIIADHGLYLRGRTVIVRDRAAIETFCGPNPYPGKDDRLLGVFAF